MKHDHPFLHSTIKLRFKKYGWLKTAGMVKTHRKLQWPIALIASGAIEMSFPAGRVQIIDFSTQKWQREFDYRLIKELWTTDGNRIAVRFAYECHNFDGNWSRSYGNEN